MSLHNTLTIARMTVKAIWNNRFAFYIVIFTPILICVNFGYAAYKSPAGVDTVILEDAMAGPLGQEAAGPLVDFIVAYRWQDGTKPFSARVLPGSPADARSLLDEKKARAVLYFSYKENHLEQVNLLVDAAEPLLVSHFQREIPLLLADFASPGPERGGQDVYPAGQAIWPTGAGGFAVTLETNAREDLKFFDHFASAIIVLVALGMPLALSSLSITLDRSMGVLERIFAVPYKKPEIIIGRMLANGFLSLLSTVTTIVTLKLVFDIALGHVGLLLLLMVLVSVNGVIFGLFLSAMTIKETQSLLAAMISLLLFMCSMTLLWPWETMHPAMQLLSRFTPYLYGVLAIRSVNMAGAGLPEVWPFILVLLAFIGAQALITILLFRRRIA